MAILFKQSKSKERLFIWIVIMIVTFILLSISFFIFPPYQNYSSYQGEIFEEYNAKIDLTILDSNKVKNLDLFLNEFKTEFSFIAKDKSGKQVTGNILALDKSEAESIISGKGLTIISIEEYSPIKNDPFFPYYKAD